MEHKLECLSFLLPYVLSEIDKHNVARKHLPYRAQSLVLYKGFPIQFLNLHWAETWRQ